MRLPVFRVALIGLYGVSLTGVVDRFLAGASFYLTPVAERAHHDGYWAWKAGGTVGHPLGIAGAGMLALLLLYSARKRLPFLRGLGSMSHWLDLHIYLGILGPMLIVLHSTFKVDGLVALSFWSMIAVALSGFAGRFLYLQIPRTRAGDEIALADLEKMDRALTAQLRSDFRLSDVEMERLESLASPPAGLLGGLVAITLGDVGRGGRLRRLANQRPGLPQGLLRRFGTTLREKAEVRWRLALWNRVHELFHYWHVIHKPFAVVMYVFMLVHVAVALMTGYGWGGAR